MVSVVDLVGDAKVARIQCRTAALMLWAVTVAAINSAETTD